jgi:uncharacterized membrane protein YebE (DUF533 family)
MARPAISRHKRAGPQEIAMDAKALLDSFLNSDAGKQAADWAGKAKDFTMEGAKEATDAAAGAIGQDRIDQAKTFVNENKLAVGAAAGGLLALLLGTRTGRSIGGAALKTGAIAVAGGLAFKAIRDFMASQGKTAAETSSPGAQAGVIQAMIGAAKADGSLDAGERAALDSRIANLAMPEDQKAALRAAIDAPASVAAIAAAAQTEQDAAEIYTAALLASGHDTTGEAQFLAELAAALKIEPDLAAKIQAEVRAAVAPA